MQIMEDHQPKRRLLSALLLLLPSSSRFKSRSPGTQLQPPRQRIQLVVDCIEDPIANKRRVQRLFGEACMTQ